MTQGRRWDNPNDEMPQPGDYGKLSDGSWYGSPPAAIDTDGFPLLANLSKHNVTEHDDGTITVSPSILITSWNGKSWHGFLERGVWREV